MFYARSLFISRKKGFSANVPGLERGQQACRPCRKDRADGPSRRDFQKNLCLLKGKNRPGIIAGSTRATVLFLPSVRTNLLVAIPVAHCRDAPCPRPRTFAPKPFSCAWGFFRAVFPFCFSSAIERDDPSRRFGRAVLRPADVRSRQKNGLNAVVFPARVGAGAGKNLKTSPQGQT